jgi:hypothetical protein
MLSAGFAFAQSREVGELKQVFFISEAWMSIAELDKPPAVRPSQDPERIEVIMVSNLAVQEAPTRVESRMAILEMIRDAEGRLTDLNALGLAEESAEGHVENSLLDAFVVGYLAGRKMLD